MPGKSFTIGGANCTINLQANFREGEVERAMRIELTALAWEARVLPLYDARSGQEGCHSKRTRRRVQSS